MRRPPPAGRLRSGRHEQSRAQGAEEVSARGCAGAPAVGPARARQAPAPSRRQPRARGAPGTRMSCCAEPRRQFHDPRSLQGRECLVRRLDRAPEQLRCRVGRQNRPRGQRADQCLCARVLPWAARSLAPSLLQSRDSLRETCRAFHCGAERTPEDLQPLYVLTLSERIQPPNVRVRGCCEHQAHRLYESWSQPAPAEDEMDQRPSNPAVPVREGVDRFELCVCDARLDRRRQIHAREEPEEIVDQARDAFRRWRDEGGVQWGIGIPADPVLSFPQRAGSARVRRVLHERAVEGEQILELHRLALVRQSRDPLHGRDVPEHRARRRVAGLTALRLGAREPSLRDLDTLDPRRRHRLRPKESPGQSLEVRDGRRIQIQGGRLLLRCGKQASERTGDHWIETADGVRDQCPVPEASASTPRAVGVRIGQPCTGLEPGHRASSSSRITNHA